MAAMSEAPRSQQSLLDELARVLRLNPGDCPLVSAIARLTLLELTDHNQRRMILDKNAEIDRLRRALAAAGVVRGSDPTLPDVAVERGEVER